MKYLFLNHFAFENIDNSINQQDIIEVLTNLAILAKDINKFNSQLIFDNKLVLLIDDIKLMEDRTSRIFLMTQIRNPKPFCSDSFDEYFEDEDIVLGNCVVAGTTIDILENFLACAMFLDSPIVTPKSICRDNSFLHETIDIQCDKKSKELKNYFLENSKEILDDIETYINWLKEEKKLEITQDNFWNRREEFFPKKIIFCKEVEKQIKDLDKTIFQQSINILRDVETNKKSITNYNHSGESQSVKNNNKLKELRCFTVDNEKVYFDNHIKYSSHRLYFLEEENKTYIGYIGQHLPTKKFK